MITIDTNLGSRTKILNFHLSLQCIIVNSATLREVIPDPNTINNVWKRAS